MFYINNKHQYYIHGGNWHHNNKAIHIQLNTTSKWYENERIEEYDTAKHWNPNSSKLSR